MVFFGFTGGSTTTLPPVFIVHCSFFSVIFRILSDEMFNSSQMIFNCSTVGFCMSFSILLMLLWFIFSMSARYVWLFPFFFLACFMFCPIVCFI